MKFINLKNLHLVIIGLFVFILLGCNRELRLKNGEFKLKSQKFEGNNSISTDRLELLIEPSQKPNPTILGLPFSPKVSLYWVGKFFYSDQETLEDIEFYKKKLVNSIDSLSIRRIKRLNKIISTKELNFKTQSNLFMRNLGEAPAILDEKRVENIANKIKDFYVANGYNDAKVTYSINYAISNTATINYQIKEQLPFRILKYDLIIADKNIENLIKKDTNSTIKIGQIFKKSDFNDDSNFDEIDRIDTLMKNNGYFDFEKIPAMIRVNAQLDTANKSIDYKAVNVQMIIENPANQSKYTQYSIKNINVETTDPFINATENTIDSSFYKGVKYIFNNRKYPVNLFAHKMTINPFETFSIKNIEETQRKIFQLNQFGNIDVEYKKVDSNKINVSFKTPALYKYTWNNELNSNVIQSTLGLGYSSTFGVRNLLGRLESIEISPRISSEGQPAIDNKIYRSLELGINTSLNFPTLLLPLKESQFRRFDNQKTQIKLGLNFSGQQQFQRTNFNLGTNYQFSPSKLENISFSFLDINITNTNKKTPEFEKQLNDLFLKGSNLKLLFGRQFVSSLSGSYSFNNTIEGVNKNSKFYKIFLESGGTSLGLFKDNRLGFLNVIGGDSLEFFRFLKGNIDFRKYINIGKKSSLAYRTNIGLAYPYGKNKSLPYEKNFFVGGTGSIRAWTPRSLGPGSSEPVPTINNENRLIAQPGDILLEGSIEHRHFLQRAFGFDVYGAAFLDVGNVWKWYKEPNRLNQSSFDLKRFWKEFAVGTGYGFRLDISYFVFRYDIGVKIYDPSQGNGLVINQLFSKKAEKTYPYRIINWTNFGIGYPF